MRAAGGLAIACAAVATLAAESISLARETVGTEPKAFLAMAGDWLIRADGADKVVVVDGRQWSSGQPSGRLAEKARAIFGADAEAFAAQARTFASFPVALAQGVDEFHDGQIGATLKILGGQLGQSGGVVFGVKPTGDYLALQVVGVEGALVLSAVHAGQRTILARGRETVVLAVNTWHEVKAVAKGTAFEGWIDGKHLLDCTLPGAVSGKVGLGSEADSVFAFKDVVVSPE